MNSTPRKFLRKSELLPIIVVLILAATICIVLSNSEKSSTAIIEQGGKIIGEYHIKKHNSVVIEGVLTVNFSPDGIFVSDSTCKDKICERTGKIAKAGETIICLPQRISIRLQGGDGYDSVTY